MFNGVQINPDQFSHGENAGNNRIAAGRRSAVGFACAVVSAADCSVKSRLGVNQLSKAEFPVQSCSSCSDHALLLLPRRNTNLRERRSSLPFTALLLTQSHHLELRNQSHRSAFNRLKR